MLVVTAFIENYGPCGYIAYSNSEKFKGLVVQADTLEDVKTELWKSLKVKLAYDEQMKKPPR